MATDLPTHLRPFVLPHVAVEPVRSGPLDLYLPPAPDPPLRAAAVLLVHGGPVPADRPVRPPQWPAFRAYGALLAESGLVGAMVEHGFVDDDALGAARDDVSEALAVLRDDDRVDRDRIGMWFFSGGGFLMGSFLDPPAEGVVGVAGTYAAVGDDELPEIGLADGIVAAPRSTVPLLLVRPEHDFDWIVPITDDLLARCREAGREVDVIDVPCAHHGFETVDDTDAARDAIRRSVAWWSDTLR